MGVPISRWFANAHDNYWESVEKYGDFFELITPFSYLVLLAGLFGYIGSLLFFSTLSQKPAEQGGTGQPATAPESKPEGKDKDQPESKLAPR